MADMIETEVMHNQRIPIGLLKLSGQMAGHVVVDLSEILQEKRKRYLALKCSTTMPHRGRAASLSASSCRTSNAHVCECVCLLTETKKLLVPSLRPKKSPGNNFSHVSSP